MNLVRGGAVPGTVRACHCDTPSIVLRGRAPASERNVGSQSTSCSIRSVVRPRTATGSAPPERNAVTLVPPSKLPISKATFSHEPCTGGQGWCIIMFRGTHRWTHSVYLPPRSGQLCPDIARLPPLSA